MTEPTRSRLAVWATTRPARHRAIGARRALVCQMIPEWEPKPVVGRKVREVAARMSVSPETVDRWRKKVRGAPEADWPYLLMPLWSGQTIRSEVPEIAWEFFRRVYLTRHRPSVAHCYRRTSEAAAEHGWGDLPSARTFQRRVKTEITARELTLKRHGPEALARMFPSLRWVRDAYRERDPEGDYKQS